MTHSLLLYCACLHHLLGECQPGLLHGSGCGCSNKWPWHTANSHCQGILKKSTKHWNFVFGQALLRTTSSGLHRYLPKFEKKGDMYCAWLFVKHHAYAFRYPDVVCLTDSVQNIALLLCSHNICITMTYQQDQWPTTAGVHLLLALDRFLFPASYLPLTKYLSPRRSVPPAVINHIVIRLEILSCLK